MAKIPLMRIPIPFIWTWFVGLFMEMVHFLNDFHVGILFRYRYMYT